VDELRFGDGAVEAVVLPEAGGRLHRLRAFGTDLLRTPDDPATHLLDPFYWGAYVMAPWCNRIVAGRSEISGHTLDLEPNFPDGSAIHGQVYQVPWDVESDGILSVLGGGTGWPWTYRVRQRLAIEPSRLLVQLALTNLSATPMPGGLGLHPWFRRPVEVRIDAARVLPSNTDPVGQFTDVTGALDLRSLGTMSKDLDAAWLPDRDPAVELYWPEIGVSALLRARSEKGVCIVAASPSSLDAIAVEPQTHAPYGLRRLERGEAHGLSWLAPGDTLRLDVGFAFEQAR
jgi:aldose 1-epimerase